MAKRDHRMIVKVIKSLVWPLIVLSAYSCSQSKSDMVGQKSKSSSTQSGNAEPPKLPPNDSQVSAQDANLPVKPANKDIEPGSSPQCNQLFLGSVSTPDAVATIPMAECLAARQTAIERCTALLGCSLYSFSVVGLPQGFVPGVVKGVAVSACGSPSSSQMDRGRVDWLCNSIELPGSIRISN